MFFSLNLISKFICKFFFFASIIIVTFQNNTKAFELISGRGDISFINANKVSKTDGDTITEAVNIKLDTLIMTGENSFARLLNDRGDTIIIGPNSKVTIELKGSSFGDLVALHDGVMRVNTKKQRKVANGKFDRLFIRTNSAVAASENSDYIISYNLFNNVTGVLAFNGKTSLKKIERSHQLSAGQRLVYRRSFSGKGNKLNYKFHKDGSLKSKLALANDLLFGKKLKDVSTVFRGQYSATFHNERPASLPIKINPVQLTILYRNTNIDMTLYNEGDSVSLDDSSVAAYPLTGNLLRPADQVTSYRGQYSLSQKKYAPKAGGLVDLRSGIYIPPEDNAVFNESFRLYVPKSVGQINSVNGNYIPPKDLKIDPNKGFVTVNKTHTSVQNKENLNNLLKTNLLLASYKNITRKKMTMAERFSANIVGVTLVNQGLTHTYNNDEFDFSSRGIELSISLTGNGIIRPFAKFKLLNENFKETSSSKEVERFYHMNLGLDYLINSRFYVSGQISIDEAPIYLNNGDKITLATINSFVGEAGFKLLSANRYDFYFLGGLKYNIGNDDDEFDMEAGVGFYFGAKLEYWLNRHSFIYSDFNYLNHSFSIVGNSNDSDIDMSGAVFNIGYRYSF